MNQARLILMIASVKEFGRNVLFGHVHLNFSERQGLASKDAIWCFPELEGDARIFAWIFSDG